MTTAYDAYNAKQQKGKSGDMTAAVGNLGVTCPRIIGCIRTLGKKPSAHCRIYGIVETST
jgi:hypothetical protein